MTSPSDRASTDFGDLLRRLPAVYRTLRESGSVATLFARVTDLAREMCGFERAVVLAVGDGYLTGAGSEALAHAPSDALRRAILASRVELETGTEEAELVWRPERPRRSTLERSVLAEALGLQHHAYAGIAPDAQVLALLVLDRAAPEVSEDDRLAVQGFGAMLAIALEQVVLRDRVNELSREVRQFSASTQALVAEALSAPVSLPLGHGVAAGRARFDGGTPFSRKRLEGLFTERELRILTLMVEGQTNREIAERLVVSTETVKSHVSRIIHKLEASNRVQAVVRYLALTHD